MDKKQLKAKLRQERTDRQREIDRMKYTHEWVSDRVYNNVGSRMQNSNVRCKNCGMGLYNFRVHPMTCAEATVHEIIAAKPLPAEPKISAPNTINSLGILVPKS